LLGYRNVDAIGVEFGTYIDIKGFVRLPTGDAAVRTPVSIDAGDCGGGRREEIQLLRENRFVVVAFREITACNEAEEPDENDPF
jgi:hypothetical protein